MLGLVAMLAAAAAPQVGEPTRYGDVRAIVDRLDMTSFPNSLAQRRAPGQRTLADHGFTRAERSGSALDLYPRDRSWMFRFTVLGQRSRGVTLCVIDRSLGSGGYDTAQVVTVVRARSGLYRAIGRPYRTPNCG